MMRCLLVIDPQKCFCKGGVLEVPNADEIIPLINKMLMWFKKNIVTQDWHPQDHSSFKTQGGKWPIHGVAGTKGAAFHSRLNTKHFTVIIRKGTDRLKEGYSAFEDTGLEGLLKSLGVTKVFICGLATDYCVAKTAKDSVKFFKETFIIKDACRAVSKETEEKELKELTEAGVKIITSDQI